MANRSTRNKLRFQAEKAASDIVRAQRHLKYLDELAGGQSPYINEVLPALVAGLDKIEAAIRTFREAL